MGEKPSAPVSDEIENKSDSTFTLNAGNPTKQGKIMKKI
jgi:hypothetical protein